MKTALQRAIATVRPFIDKGIEAELKFLLEEEREQIVEAWIQGIKKGGRKRPTGRKMASSIMKKSMAMRHKKRRDSKAGWILYLMIHIPFIWWVKIGITGRTAAKRANDIDEAVFGFPVPIFVLVIPGAYFAEQALHSFCKPLNVRFYTGDGASEWFWLPAVIPALLFMLAGWGLYFWMVSQVTNWDGLEWYLNTLGVVVGWIASLIS